MPSPDRPESVAALMGRSPWFSHDAEGNVVRRERTCECGKTFAQTLLSERFLTMCERQSRACLNAVTQQIPGYFVPVHCPHCERIDVGRWAHIAESRSVPDTQPFGERDAA